MKGKIALITVWADDVPGLAQFYRSVLGFEVESENAHCVELENDGVRFVIHARSNGQSVTGHPGYAQPKSGQSFALAFALRAHEQVDEAYADVVAKGAMPIQWPTTTLGGQRTAFFADPEGNIHQLFADLPAVAEYCW